MLAYTSDLASRLYGYLYPSGLVAPSQTKSSTSAWQPTVFDSDMVHDHVWSPSQEHKHMATPSEIQPHYRRAAHLARTAGIKVDDILHLTERFWDFHLHHIACRDLSASTVISIHWNLCIGTIASFAHDRPELQDLLTELENFNICGEFMLTELGHGLDARNLETTATLMPDGSFVLHTPSIHASKTMPPTTPNAGVPRVAVVFARLMVRGEDRGVKPFVVRINEAHTMCPGVTSKALPYRAGATPVDHAITSFDHVRLESHALLGSLDAADNPRKDFFKQIHRVSIGTLGLSMANIPTLKQACYIVGTYSMRRHVASPQHGATVPIVTFRTQHRPILTGLAQAEVFQQYAYWAIQQFKNDDMDDRVRHGIACAFKATLIKDSQATLNELIDRCGWQGLFGHNNIIEQWLSHRGNSIAEGDVLVLCIRLASELLLGKYTLPQPRYPDSLLARHEAGLFNDLKTQARNIVLWSGSHRSDAFNARILPWCRPLVEAIGARMAHEAAVDAGVRPEILALFESNCLAHDPAWYIENTHLTRSKLADMDVTAIDAMYPLLAELLEATGAAEYVTAPILTQEKWESYVETLQTFDCTSDTSTASVDTLPLHDPENTYFQVNFKAKARAASLVPQDYAMLTPPESPPAFD